MDLVKRILAVFLVATGIAAAALLIATPLFHDGSPDYPAWKVLNWFMAAGALIILVVSYMRKHVRGADELIVTEYLRLNLVYYGAIALTMLFFWEWFWTLNPDSETGDAITSHLVYFPLTDALFVALALSVGRRLWREVGSTGSTEK